MSSAAALIAPTADARLAAALMARLRRHARFGSIGELEPIALRLGMVQATLEPRLESPRLLVFAADHGLALEGRQPGDPRDGTHALRSLLDGSALAATFARVNGVELTVVDSGISESFTHPRLLSRKIGHGTRNARVAAAMSVEQAHAAIRAGMEIADTLRGSVIACAGIGNGAPASAALVLSCLSGVPVHDFVDSAPGTLDLPLEQLAGLLESARARHAQRSDPVEVLAAVGGYEIAMMAGVMLAAASRRRVIVPDGSAACAALRVAASIAPAVLEYCLFARSNWHPGLDRALELFDAQPMPSAIVDAMDGTGATLAWPFIRAAAALLGSVDG
ncbi:nicotinate-nucleotide--dimethylbenzimidazole phosphoribosyltransferase [Piscinibacter koreensis]|uniref:Nicotinate-nucleotide--dimethylbenzimidazole phosphoribosyltransferase n=1 Tax=Piscinibacter koreensis TaxID=2742824 RepID=A0A7Y6TW80_9BURK|nr:nicotinate-nucleotide--dimethylbenzimidazole phosphoribosyltransferase [Schlegelella koreensis]NUZ05747.1 nicotinate-nucleotide--dimethylbenzimidazole phosphoribosyltransferase [Schlegelella koreensis]